MDHLCYIKFSNVWGGLEFMFRKSSSSQCIMKFSKGTFGMKINKFLPNIHIHLIDITSMGPE